MVDPQIISVHTVIQANYTIVALIIMISAFIFLRRIVLLPFQYWSDRRRKIYMRVLSDILKYQERAGRFRSARFLGIRNIIDKLALEEILLEKMSSTQNAHLKEMLTKIYEDLGMADWRIRHLHSLNSWKRKMAADILGRSLSKKAIGPLTRISLRDRNEDVRFIATKSLGKLDAVESIPHIISLLKGLPYERCAVVADILIDFDKHSAPHLCKGLANPDQNTRFWCVRTLAEIDASALSGPLHNEIKKKLSELLNDENPETRGYSAICLAKIGAKNTSDKIAEILNSDKEPPARSLAALALGIMKDPGSIPVLIQAMSDQNWDVNHSACRALAMFGTEIGTHLNCGQPQYPNTALERCKELAEELGINDFVV